MGDDNEVGGNFVLLGFLKMSGPDCTTVNLMAQIKYQKLSSYSALELIVGES